MTKTAETRVTHLPAYRALVSELGHRVVFALLAENGDHPCTTPKASLRQRAEEAQQEARLKAWLKKRDFKPHDRVWRWVWTGGNDMDLQTMTVIRVNRKTITVRTDSGYTLRLRPIDIAGRVDWDES